jgi:hypothetical protein
MTQLHSYQDSRTGCYANVRMDNGDPCFIGVAQTGVLVKKSRIGFFGAKLYEQTRVYEAAMTAKALAYLLPGNLAPDDMTNPVLKAFTNAVLHCSTLAEVVRMMNSAVQVAEHRSGKSIGDLEVQLLPI